MNAECASVSPPKKKFKQISIMESLNNAGFSKCDNLSESSKDHCAVEIEPENEDFPTCHSPDIFATDIETPIQFSNVSLVEASKISTASSENIRIQTKISKQVEFQSLHWKGKPLSEMCNFFGDSSEFIELQQSICHTILFRFPLAKNRVPEPYPPIYEDFWDASHVKMPCSSSNIYPVKEDGQSSLKPRWNLIEEAYQKLIYTSLELEKSILSYNSRYDQIWSFQGLHTLVNKVLTSSESERFFKKTLPGIIQLALRVSNKVTRSPVLLARQRNRSLSLSQSQIACLLANAFLCTFPRRNTQKKQSEFSSYPDINFVRLFENKSKADWIYQKLKCLLHYFDRVIDEEPTGVVTFSRLVIAEDDFPDWEKVDATFGGFHVSSEGTIEKEGAGLLQIDFANRFIGGGVLGWGCVQEEIRFIICPELIVACLFTEVMEKNEALSITGCERYCNHSGYSSTFRFEGDYVDTTPRDEFGRRLCKLVAMDALRFRRTEVQYQRRFVERELNKAYVGFHSPKPNIPLAAVATGNWGCGAYRGDPRLKCLLQLMAAAQAGRDVVYFTFGDVLLRDDLYNMYTTLIEKKVTIGHLYQILCQYGDQFGETESPSLDLYGYIYAILDSCDSESEVDVHSIGSPSSGGVAESQVPMEETANVL